MNWIDIVIIVPLLWALYRGWRSGIFIQVGMIAGLIAGIALTYFIGTAVTSWLNVTNPVGKIVTYITLSGVVLFLVVWIARMISEAFSAAGLGVVDRAGGSLFSLLKMVIIVSVVMTGLQWANKKWEMIPEQTLDQSALFYPAVGLTSYAFPFLDLAREKIDEWHVQDDKRTDEREADKQRESIQDNR